MKMKNVFCGQTTTEDNDEHDFKKSRKKHEGVNFHMQKRLRVRGSHEATCIQLLKA